MANSRRIYRVAEQIRALIATEVIKSQDSRLELVTITSVRPTSDLREAKIYWIVHGGPERRVEVEQAFTENEKTFRQKLARQLTTRFAPKIRFYYDDTLDTIEEIDRLLGKIK